MRRKILVVDDEPGIRLLLTDLFVQEGFDVITGSTGLEALTKVEEQSVDLIILDFQLPVLDGAGVIMELKQNESTIPLIIMSGLIVELKKKLQAYDFIKGMIAKPFHIQEITNLVHSVLR